MTSKAANTTDPAMIAIAVNRAALKWCGEKQRETSLDDIRYFEANWRALPGLGAYVDRELTALRTILKEQSHETR